MARAFAFTGKLRRWLGHHPSKQVERPKKLKPPAPSVSRWLALEPLEGRLVPAVDYVALSQGLSTQLDNLSGVVRNYANESKAVLPILGSSLADQATRVQSAVRDARDAITPALRALNGNAGQAAIKTALLNTGVVRDLDNNGLNANDVLITDYNPANGTITITIRMGKAVELAGTNYKFDLGLPGVPFGLTGNSKLSVDLDVDYNRLSFGMRNGAFFVESPTGRTNTLTVTVTANAKDTNLIGTIGFFEVKGKAMPGLPAAEVKAGLVLNANGVSLSSPRLVGSAAVNMNLDATIKSNGTGLTFPHMTTDFQMSWNLSGSHNVANRDALGTAPSVAFNNIQFGLGSFLGNMVKPIAEAVQEITVPVAPIYELMAMPLPGLTHLSEAAGLGTVTLDKLAALAVAGKVLPPDYQLLAELSLNMHTLVALLRDADFGSQNDVLIPVGSFNLSGNGDLRKSTLTNGFTTLQQWAQAGISNFNLKDLTKLIPAATSGLESIQQKINTGNLPAPVRGVIQDTFRHINEQLRKLENGIGLSFPLLENPVSVYKLLLGQDVDFARFDAKFVGSARQTEKLKVWGPVDAEFIGTINLKTELHAGVDTFGLRTFFMDIASGRPADPDKLDDGLWVDSSKELVRINGDITAKAGVDIAFGTGLQFFAYAGLSGKVETAPADIVVKFVDPNPRGDHRLRLLKTGEVGNSLFIVEGSMKANFEFKVEVGARVVIPNPIPGSDDIVLIESRRQIYHLTIADAQLFNTQSINPRNPFNSPTPIDNEIDVIYDVNFKDGSNDDNRDTIRAQFTDNNLHLYFNGVRTETYKLKNVRSLKIIGSDDGEEITVERPTKSVSVDGGFGDDELNYDDSAWTRSNPLYVVSETRVVRFHTGVVFTTHGNIEKVFVQGSSTNPNDFRFTPMSVFTQVIGGDADDKFSFGGTGKTLDGALSPIIDGRGGFNRLSLDDSGDDRQATYTIGHEGLARSTYVSFYSPTLGRSLTYQDSYQFMDFFGIDYVELKGAGLGNDFYVDDLPDPREDTIPSPLFIDLHTGVGADDVRVLATTTTLNIFGQAGHDVVTVGGPGYGTRSVFGDVNVANFGSYTRLNVDDADTTTNRTIFMDTTSAGDRGFIYGLTGPALGGSGQSRISYKTGDTAAVTVTGGNGFNTISVADTAGRGLATTLPTTIRTGTGLNGVFVAGTTGVLTIEGGGPLTGVVVGALPNQTGNLSGITAPVTLRGRLSGLSITDSGSNAKSMAYAIDASHFRRTNSRTGVSSAFVYYDRVSMTSYNVTMGNGGNTFTIDGTPTLVSGFNSGINIITGTGSDVGKVHGTNGPISLDLGAGSYQSVSIGDATHSLDAIRGPIGVTGGGFIDAFVSNEASTWAQTARITALTDFFGDSQAVERAQFNGEGFDKLNTFGFRFSDEGRISYQAGRGGDSLYVEGTSQDVPVILNGGAGKDLFWVEPDRAPLLAPVYVNGKAAHGDFAHYYDYFTRTPQTYTFSGNANTVVGRSGAAPVTYIGVTEIITHTAHVGDNQVRVRTMPADLSLEMNVADNDVVTVGNPTPMSGGVIGGSMNPIRGTVSVIGGQNVSLVLDDTAATRGRNATLQPGNGDDADSITGMGPGVVRWKLDPASTVDIRGGRFNDSFAINGVFEPVIHIDGGAGTNTLDYSNYVNNSSGPVSWYRGEYDFTDAVGGHHGSGVNGAGFAEAGISGAAFDFDGIDDYVVIPNHGDLAPAALTLEARISPNAWDGNRVIVSKYDDNDPGGSGKSWVLSVVDGHVRFGVFSGLTGRVIQTNDSIVGEGGWRHIAATFDSLNNIMRLYVDGQELECSYVEGFEGEVGAINPSETPVRIGVLAGDALNGYFSGRIDDVRIYGRVLSAAEVRANSEVGNDSPPAGSAQGVRVHLPSGTATGLEGGVSRIQNVIGSAFDDILTGNGGNVLTGGAGRDFLVAGRTASTLNGGDGEDVLIGGYLYADDADGELDPDALEALAAAWSRLDVDYSTRSDTLRGMLAGPLFRNGGSNVLQGQGDLDLFFANEGDLGDWNGVELRVTG